MKCKYCDNDSEKITGYWFDDGSGCCEEEGDFICTKCMEKLEKANKGDKKDETK